MEKCLKPDCPVSSSDKRVLEVDSTTVPGRSAMDADLLPELSGETWVAATLLEGLTADLPPFASDRDLIVASRQDATLTTSMRGYSRGQPRCGPNVRVCLLSCGVGDCSSGTCQWTRKADCGVAVAPPSGASQLVVPGRERQNMIRRFHDSLFVGHLDVSQTIYRLWD